jgi:hypothetical protein
MTDNYVDLDVLANSDVSSEQAAFPVTNAYSKTRRSKVWRSNGYYKVTSLNNTIVLRDDANTDKYASIAIGEYNSAASFMSAVDAALESAGAANYTVTQSSSLKFIITSDLSGGSTAFKLMTSDPLFTAIDLLGFDDSIDRTGASSYTADYLRINQSEWILWDMGISTNPKNFILIGSRNSAIKISPSAVVKLQGNFTNNFSAPAYEATLNYDDQAIYKFSDTGLHTQALRYWRLYIEDQNPTGYVEVGSFFLGNHFDPTRGRVKFPFQSDYIDRSTTVYSEGGQSYSDVQQQSQKFSIEWNALTKDEMQKITDFFNEYGTARPFFISFDSDASFTPTANQMIKYVKFENEPSYQLVSPNNFSCNMKLREEL